MEDIANEFMDKEQTPAEFLKKLGTTVPEMNLNKMFSSRGLGREDVEKMLNQIPATEVRLDVSNGWDDQHQLVLGLLSGRYIEKLRIAGCGNPIKAIPPSTRDLEIEVLMDYDCAAISMTAGAPNLRRLTLINGIADHNTCTRIASRSTKLHLTLLNTGITDFSGNKNMMSKLSGFELQHVTFEDKILTRENLEEEIMRLLIEKC